ncbi:7 transmembrane receptor (rhodopsin family) protein [Brugia pahangi]
MNNTNFIHLTTLAYQHYRNSSTFQLKRINNMLSGAVILCDILGCLCIILNLFIISIIIRHRKKILKNIFYILVFHCSIVDLLRGCCLIIWGLPHTLISNYTAIYDRLLILKISKFATMILRSCNLLTIFNLLIFTCNEFTVVHYPLFYRHRFRRRIVLIYLLFSWLISFIPGIVSLVFSNFFKSSQVTTISNDNNYQSNGTFYSTGMRSNWRITNRRTALMFVNIASMFVTFLFCYLSLLIVLFSYGSIMCTIRRLRKANSMNEDLSLPLRLKRNVSVFKLTSDRTNSLQSVFSRNNSEKSRCHWKSHLMCKYKHLVVIGTVLFVYILFLLPYSGIQLVAILHVTNVIVVPSHFALIKWSLQILTGLHAICQPLCYFRMVEFRLLACSGRQIRQQRSFSSNTIY